MPLNGQTVRDALAAVRAVGKQLRSFDELAVGGDAALRQAPAGLTPDGAASFLATCAQESAYFRTTREYGTGQRYAPFIGRGFVQVTWEANYRAFGAWCRARGLVDRDDTFARDVGLLEDYRWAWLTAVWYFESTGLWPYANRGDHRAVSQGVNGGTGRIGSSFTPNHWSERAKMFDAFRRAGSALLPASGAPAVPPSTSGRPTLREGDESDLIWRLAGFMNENFRAYSRIERGPGPRCRLGPQCRAALEEFQRRSGIPTDPPFAVAARTWQALERAGFRG